MSRLAQLGLLTLGLCMSAQAPEQEAPHPTPKKKSIPSRLRRLKDLKIWAQSLESHFSKEKALTENGIPTAHALFATRFGLMPPHNESERERILKRCERIKTLYEKLRAKDFQDQDLIPVAELFKARILG